MRNPLSKKIVDIQPSGIRKFFDVANEMKDAISLGVGEPDFQNVEHRRLARARRAQNDGQFAFFDAEAHIIVKTT